MIQEEENKNKILLQENLFYCEDNVPGHVLINGYSQILVSSFCAINPMMSM